MICYYTHINVNEDLNQERLIQMFLEWINTSKNKIEQLNYTFSSSFEYKEERKQLKIEDFKEYNILGIQFITSDNYKKAQFIVEILFDYINQTLDLGFYKELNKDSKYIEAISLPKIFVQLLSSSYIKKDHHLQIQNEPYFLSYKEYQQIIKQDHQLPLIVLTKNEKCCVNPFKLAKRLFGIGHVLCIRSKSNKKTMKIHYSQQNIQQIENESETKMMAQCYNEVLNYSIQEHTQNYMFDELTKARLHHEHNSTQELENFYLSEFEGTKQELMEYEQLLSQIQQEYDELLQRKKELDRKIKSYEKEALLVAKTHYIEKQQILEHLLHKSLQSFPKTEVYRKRDVLTSIVKENVYDPFCI